MTETCQQAETFLTELLADLRFNLRVSSEWNDDGCMMNLSGDDIPLLLSENGEMLDAFEVLLFQIYGRDFERTQRFICDADGFRQSRKAELQAMARFAAQNVRKNGRPFTFGKLNSTERRVIHLTLQVEEDLRTESVGEGKDRRLQVSLK
ncbi:MAG TPA: R3H domain-containing nucleic acid-binding protein [Pyrinomonadaceae bacterium]|jgi:spoIIIJ-associated protein